jgi:hypothetical protein
MTLLFGIGITYTYMTQEGRLFTATRLPLDFELTFDAPFEERRLEREDGASLSLARFFAKERRGTILYFHGRGGNLQKKWGGAAADFTARGYDVVMPDYRGFGKSRGRITQEALLEDALAVFDEVVSLYPGEPIMVYGCSLGTGFASYVAAHRPVGKLFLESPFFSLIELSYRNVPSFFPKRLLPALFKFPMRTHEWITGVKSPIHIFHSKIDEVIDYSASTRLIALLEEHPDITFTTIESALHSAVRRDPLYKEALTAALGSEVMREASSSSESD